MQLPLTALVVEDGVATLLPAGGAATTVRLDELAGAAGELERSGTRWVWWSARAAAGALLAGGVRPAACWDLAAVHRLLRGGRRDDEAAVTAAVGGSGEPPLPDDGLTLLQRDGSLRPDDLDRLARARLALDVQRAQAAAVAGHPDPRTARTGTGLGLLTAHAESAAAVLAEELGQDGLPFDAEVAAAHLTTVIGPPGAPASARDAAVLRHFRSPADLRNPASVLAMLRHGGIDVPDTRSHRLEPLADGHAGVAALLAWRKTERIATTYGWSWLAQHVSGGRLRGQWQASDGAAGRMTASAGLHNLPAALRRCVVADAGHVLVRADLGQVEPRVLAVVSGDPALAAASRDPDMYAPVARQLAVDRPTAKVAVLAAMYGQTSGAAGQALARMERAYPVALDCLRAAEEHGRTGVDVRTWGGRRVRMGAATEDPSARGRYARNAVVQGAAAELFKAWAVTTRAALPPYGARVVLCLHDELLVHAPAGHGAAVTELLAATLDATAAWWASGRGVRFVVEVASGRSWAEAKAPPRPPGSPTGTRR